MARVKPQETAFRPGKNTKRVERKDYLSFIRDLPCVICCASPIMGIDAAHLSKAKPEYGHFGRGKGQKVSDRWALPLCRKCHLWQHDVGEERFWGKRDPHLACLVLWGLWSDLGEDATDMVTELNWHLMKGELG